jgi:hypothetical protein
VGKGDYTSGYTTPHIYIIDGKTKEIEAVLGEVDEVKQWLGFAILIGSVLAVIQIGIIARLWIRKRRIWG